MAERARNRVTPGRARQPVVLVVEDETAQREILVYNLEADGFTVLSARSGKEALLLVKENEPDLIILDWMMPNLSGIEVCRRLRADHSLAQIPIIMLSARSDEVDRVHGLATGADDYLVKPYSVVELMARVRARLRRSGAPDDGIIREFEGIVVNSETHRVYRNGEELSLGPIEFRLLLVLIDKPGRVWSRGQLLDRIWGRDVYVNPRTVDVHIARLRRALHQHKGQYPLRTIRGFGYAIG